MDPYEEMWLRQQADVGGIESVRNVLDENGHPAGGHAYGTGYTIQWQNGPILEAGGRNGAFVEDIIKVCILRIMFYNETVFSCRQNSLAITHLQEALHWLEDRTRLRKFRGVEGTHTP